MVSERSVRRTQVEGLLRVLGTPCVTPESFLNGNEAADEGEPAIEAPMTLHAVALESTLGGGSMGDIVDQALPDLAGDEATAPPARPPVAARPGRQALQNLE